MWADRDRALLRDILAHGEEAMAGLRGTTLASFSSDRRLRLATERLLEIVGEAAGALSEEVRAEIEFDWRAVRGLRNILAHQYGAIDAGLVHRTVTTSLPRLVAAVKAALGKARPS